MTKNRFSSSKVLGIALAGALAALAFSASARDEGDAAVQIAVVDPETDRERTSLAPNDILELQEGDRVVLELFERDPRSRERHYLSGSFQLEEGSGRVSLVNVDPRRGTAVLEVSGAAPGGRVAVAFRVTEGLRYEGRFFVHVDPGPQSAEVDGATARRLVEVLYRGILLREPEERAQGWVDEIVRGGLPAVAGVATEIAESRESQIHLYTKPDVCNQTRLLALNEHLLRRDSRDLDRETWERHLDLMGSGKIAEVVTEMVRSPEFRELHGPGRTPAVRPKGSDR